MIIVPPVNFISTAAGGGLLLDGFSPTMALSTRKVLTAYAGSCLRVRRISDDAEQDIGFSGSALDTSALTTFCSGTDGYVVKWYDQSGNGFDAAQATAASQMLIVSSGAIANTVNSNPALTGNNDGYFTSSATTGDLIDATGAYTLFGSLRVTGSSNPTDSPPLVAAILADHDADWTQGAMGVSAVVLFEQYATPTSTISIGISYPQTSTFVSRWDDTNLKGYVDGGSATSAASSGTVPSTFLVNVCANFFGGYKIKGYVLEIFTFDTELNASDTNLIGAGVATYNGASWSNIS